MQRHPGGAIAAALVLALVACSPGGQEWPSSAAGTGDAALRQTLSAYVVEFLRRNPTTNTYLGGAGLDPSLMEVDGALRDHSASALQAEDRWLSITARVLGVPDDVLSEAARIDRDVALAQIRFMLRQHQVRRYQERALDTYVGEPFRAIDWQVQGLSRTGDGTFGSTQEWTRVIARVRAVPAFLAVAREQIEAGVRAGNPPDPRMLERDGLATSEANAQYFREALPGIGAERIAGDERERLVAELRAAGRDASAAYLRFREFIATTFFEPGTRTVKPAFAGDRFAMGGTEYDWALQNNFRIERTARELFDEAWPVVQATQRQMIDLARQIGQHHGWPLPADGPGAVRAVLDELSKNYPKSDADMVSWYRDAATKLVEYGRRTGLFDVPDDYQLEIVETPAPLQASVDGAAYYPAPPFRNTGIGRFYVTPTHDDPAALRSNNRASLAYLAAHEGFPGHDWYYRVLAQAGDTISPVRWLTPGAVEDSSAMWEDSLPAEGWGLYAEALMAEPQPGAPTGFYSPEERLYQLQGRIYRDLRVFIDTGIHTGRLEYDQATSLFSEVVDFLPGTCDAAGRARSDTKRASCDAAERAIFRYSKWPTQAITYRIGMDQIRALRDEAATGLGARFSAKEFHLRFIRQGTIPSGYFRGSLLGELGVEKRE